MKTVSRPRPGIGDLTVPEIWRGYSVKPHQYRYILAIHDNPGVSNDALSKIVGVSPQETGQQTTMLERVEVIRNLNSRGLKKAWSLTPTIEPYESIKRIMDKRSTK